MCVCVCAACACVCECVHAHLRVRTRWQVCVARSEPPHSTVASLPPLLLHPPQNTGKVENTERFLRVALFQGVANKRAKMKVRPGTCKSANNLVPAQWHPLFFCARAWQENQFIPEQCVLGPRLAWPARLSGSIVYMAQNARCLRADPHHRAAGQAPPARPHACVLCVQAAAPVPLQVGCNASLLACYSLDLLQSGPRGCHKSTKCVLHAHGQALPTLYRGLGP